jgi:hypothetical protein
MRRNQSRFTEKKSTKLTVVFMMAERIFISGELDGVNYVDGLMSTGLTGVGFNWKKLQGRFIFSSVRSGIQCR